MGGRTPIDEQHAESVIGAETAREIAPARAIEATSGPGVDAVKRPDSASGLIASPFSG